MAASFLSISRGSKFQTEALPGGDFAKIKNTPKPTSPAGWSAKRTMFAEWERCVVPPTQSEMRKATMENAEVHIK